MAHLIGSIPKGRGGSAEIRIYLDVYMDRPVCDVRVWAVTKESNGELVRTGRGVTFVVGKLPAVIEALQQAHELAKDEAEDDDAGD
jgi:hypothetical protein